jgi:hypothetical protein
MVAPLTGDVPDCCAVPDNGLPRVESATVSATTPQANQIDRDTDNSRRDFLKSTGA